MTSDVQQREVKAKQDELTMNQFLPPFLKMFQNHAIKLMLTEGPWWKWRHHHLGKLHEGFQSRRGARPWKTR